MARTSGSHPLDPGSIPGIGIFFSPTKSEPQWQLVPPHVPSAWPCRDGHWCSVCRWRCSVCQRVRRLYTSSCDQHLRHKRSLRLPEVWPPPSYPCSRGRTELHRLYVTAELLPYDVPHLSKTIKQSYSSSVECGREQSAIRLKPYVLISFSV